MLPVVGETAQYIRAATPEPPLAALIVFVDDPSATVTVIAWIEQGNQFARYNVPWITPGDPIPSSDYVRPLPPRADPNPLSADP